MGLLNGKSGTKVFALHRRVISVGQQQANVATASQDGKQRVPFVVMLQQAIRNSGRNGITLVVRQPRVSFAG
ncbi:hypothetical protein DUE52_07785 [Larkinella punicea]|uniref:Uncharacterized protein n=1 Tax=Larkinella punicea TaxID=2315727 RepID=A0A368JTH5_9BACT|nr:hypothetical protein DUE52_07785 [Larkinella punicea]